jgi:flagellar biosynthesis protein FliQ
MAREWLALSRLRAAVPGRAMACEWLATFLLRAMTRGWLPRLLVIFMVFSLLDDFHFPTIFHFLNHDQDHIKGGFSWIL